MTRTLYLLGAAAPPVLHMAGAVEDAQARGWDVCVGVTPAAAGWLGRDGVAELERVSGHPVRWEPRRPGEGDVWPAADVIAFAPVTANSLNAWALGLTPSWVVGAVVAGVGRRVPMVAMPCVNQVLAAHPQVDRSVAVLREAGARVLYGEGGWVPNRPGEGRPEAFPWGAVLDAVDQEARPGQ
ncbi:flavoprotein [Streptomyces sanyensis]|uniref:flavoprotein n=1 Tax=Streptomyces sanyensis TaxID=568869 RepID=UPI003D77BA3B